MKKINDTFEEKQNYLRIHILEKGYDIDKFTDFLQQKKGEYGLDLNLWEIDELIYALQDFIKNNPLAEVLDCEEENKKNPKNEMNQKTLL